MDTQPDRDHPLISLRGSAVVPFSKASQPLTWWLSELCKNKHSTASVVCFDWELRVSTLKFHCCHLSTIENHTHTVNRNILSNAPSGADGKGTTGWALGTVGIQGVWRTTLPLSNKRLKRFCAATTRDENVWITLWSGLEKCTYPRLGSDTRGSLGARKSACTPGKLKTF